MNSIDRPTAIVISSAQAARTKIDFPRPGTHIGAASLIDQSLLGG